jgi:hypothetical protein
VTAEPEFTPPPKDEVCEKGEPTDDTSGYHFNPGRLEKSNDACAVADSNLKRDEAAILKATAARPPANSKPWDKKAALLRIAPIQKRFALDKTELAKLGESGVAVLPRTAMPSYAYAYHEIFQ